MLQYNQHQEVNPSGEKLQKAVIYRKLKKIGYGRIQMQRFKLSTKMVSLGLICIVCVTLVLIWVYFRFETMVYREKQSDLKSVTEVAFSLLADYESRVKSGELTLEDAQKRAALRIKGLRYNGQEYFWINDFGPTMIMHPFKPELDGKDLRDFAGPQRETPLCRVCQGLQRKERRFCRLHVAQTG